MKVVLVKENDNIGILEGCGKISSTALSLRSRLTASAIRYYALDYDESLGLSLEAYVATLNKYPEMLGESEMIREIV